jgi:pimeloyl-ACP methyl ester carboxylesterase
MAIHTELVQFQATDGQVLHGLLFQPTEPRPPTDLALLLVHGVAMNFYTGPLPAFGQALAERGYHALCINTRGHDWISRGVPDWSSFIGASYETFEESGHDYDGALTYLAERGYRRYVLMGHSLGGVKSIMYQGSRQRPDVVGIVSCSSPRQYYSARVEEQPNFPQEMDEAEALIAAGRGDELLWRWASGARAVFTARTFENKYGRHEQNDLRPYAARLGCPLLAIAGSAEHPYFPSYASELAERAGPDRGELRIVEGANHFYDQHEQEVIDSITQWLARFGDAGETA